MPKLTRQQVETVRDYVAEHPEMAPYSIGNYFGRVADLEDDTVGRITTVAMMIQEGNDSEEQLAPFIDDAGSR